MIESIEAAIRPKVVTAAPRNDNSDNARDNNNYYSGHGRRASNTRNRMQFDRAENRTPNNNIP